MLKVLPIPGSAMAAQSATGAEGTYASTLENSCDGWMTKLSEFAVHEMRCCILGSSSMLSRA